MPRKPNVDKPSFVRLDPATKKRLAKAVEKLNNEPDRLGKVCMADLHEAAIKKYLDELGV